MLHENPFKITTPEDLTAEEAVKLFVDVFTDFYQITDPGHVLIKGPRGVGKSMMLRYLEPDCQCLARGLKLSELPFVAIYIPLKNSNFFSTELKRFENKHAAAILNEHLMVTHCLLKVLDDIKSCVAEEITPDALKRFYRDIFADYLNLPCLEEADSASVVEIFDCMIGQLKKVYRQIMAYVKNSAFSNDVLPYSGPLYDYNDYLVPILESLSKVISKKGATIYLLLDDAHFLSEIQTRILNTWLSSRSSRKVSLKISTQYNYKCYYTINGATIDTPHDYMELDVATIYTVGSRKVKGTYYDRIFNIVKRRLELYGINIPVSEFFPPDEDQERKIREIEEQYKQKYDEGKGRGYNRSDDAKRYARPDYIKKLAGVSKSTYTYSYAGFDQLVNISSGVVRYFLQQAHAMYAKQRALVGADQAITFIDPSVQTAVVRETANNALFNELESYTTEGHEVAYPKEDIQRLSNLIQGLGGLFKKILFSEKSERRVFSVAISDEISGDVERIFDIGIQLGYFHRATIGRKNSGGIGRARLYVLNRRLAPVWSLDPNGFAGYLFLKNQVLEDLIKNPITTVSHINMKETDNSAVQMSLFDMGPQYEIGSEEDNDEEGETS